MEKILETEKTTVYECSNQELSEIKEWFLKQLDIIESNDTESY